MKASNKIYPYFLSLELLTALWKLVVTAFLTLCSCVFIVFQLPCIGQASPSGGLCDPIAFISNGNLRIRWAEHMTRATEGKLQARPTSCLTWHTFLIFRKKFLFCPAGKEPKLLRTIMCGFQLCTMGIEILYI